MVIKSIPAGVFKQGCLALLDEVSSQGIELIVTKRGRPVARVVPILAPSERDADTLSALRKTTRLLASDEVFLRPSSAVAPWKAQKGRGGTKPRAGGSR
ncbi:MAG TPA: type II toxin-antitoxin system prevent-host-death family antitoxin [Polyangiaceae bacterium]